MINEMKINENAEEFIKNAGWGKRNFTTIQVTRLLKLFAKEQVKTLQSEKAELVEILREFIDPLTGLVYGHIECAIGKEKAFKIEQLLTKYKRL